MDIVDLAMEIASEMIDQGYVRMAMEQGWDSSDYLLTADDCDFVREQLEDCTQQDLVDVQNQVRQMLNDALDAETLKIQMQEAEDIYNQEWVR